MDYKVTMLNLSSGIGLKSYGTGVRIEGYCSPWFVFFIPAFGTGLGLSVPEVQER